MIIIKVAYIPRNTPPQTNKILELREILTQQSVFAIKKMQGGSVQNPYFMIVSFGRPSCVDDFFLQSLRHRHDHPHGTPCMELF